MRSKSHQVEGCTFECYSSAEDLPDAKAPGYAWLGKKFEPPPPPPKGAGKRSVIGSGPTPGGGGGGGSGGGARGGGSPAPGPPRSPPRGSGNGGRALETPSPESSHPGSSVGADGAPVDIEVGDTADAAANASAMEPSARPAAPRMSLGQRAAARRAEGEARRAAEAGRALGSMGAGSRAILLPVDVGQGARSAAPASAGGPQPEGEEIPARGRAVAPGAANEWGRMSDKALRPSVDQSGDEAQPHGSALRSAAAGAAPRASTSGQPILAGDPVGSGPGLGPGSMPPLSANSSPFGGFFEGFDSQVEVARAARTVAEYSGKPKNLHRKLLNSKVFEPRQTSSAVS